MRVKTSFAAPIALFAVFSSASALGDGRGPALPGVPPGPIVRPVSPGAVRPPSIHSPCAARRTPHVTAVDGKESGYVFEPGKPFVVTGCMFGSAGGRGYLSGLSGKNPHHVPLIIDAWSDEEIKAHIDPQLSGVRDLFSVALKVAPTGAAELDLTGWSTFKAARAETEVYPERIYAYHHPELFNGIWGRASFGYEAPGRLVVTRYLGTTGTGQKFCPAWDSNALPFDAFPVSDVVDGDFEVVRVNAENRTGQSASAVPRDGDHQYVLVGGFSAVANAKRVTVQFQGFSDYEQVTLPGVGGGTSVCRSSYAISLTVRGPRGVPGGVVWASVNNGQGIERVPPK
jgi:hypothetical protein